jgi:hypothetical protein
MRRWTCHADGRAKSCVNGNVHGGQEPISGATVSFYETASTGVATSGVYVPATPLTALGSTTIGTNGSDRGGLCSVRLYEPQRVDSKRYRFRNELCDGHAVG